MQQYTAMHLNNLLNVTESSYMFDFFLILNVLFMYVCIYRRYFLKAFEI
jgi:hypothetical protein